MHTCVCWEERLCIAGIYMYIIYIYMYIHVYEYRGEDAHTRAPNSGFLPNIICVYASIYRGGGPCWRSHAPPLEAQT